MRKHSDMGPSAADRWMTCTASVQAIRELAERGAVPPRSDEDEGSAAEGTVAHAVREEALRTGSSPFDQVGRKITIGKHAIVVDEQMADDLVAGIDWLREQLDDIEVELQVRLDPWMPNQIGTLDAGGVARQGLLISNDFKYGIGNIVEAYENRQGRLYALGLWHRLGRPPVDGVLLVIDQPRRGGMKFWKCTVDDLLTFGDEVSATYLQIATGDVEFKPSAKACRYCPVKDTQDGCAAYDKFYANLLEEARSPLWGLIGGPRFLDPDRMHPAKRWDLVRHANEIKNWLDMLSAKSLDAALCGSPDPGSKAVDGKRGPRKITDPVAADRILFDALGTDAYQPIKLIGITEIERKLKPGIRKVGNPEAWNDLLAIIEQDDAKPVLADADDPREVYGSMVDLFDDL